MELSKRLNQQPIGGRQMGTVASSVLDLAIRHQSYSRTLEASFDRLDSGQTPDELLNSYIEEALDGMQGLKEEAEWLA
jgi:hypothetical protein